MDVLTPKEVARLTKVRAMLAAGESPYAELANKGQLGGPVGDKQAYVPPDLSKTKLKQLRAKWQERPTTPEPAYIDIDLGPLVQRDPTKLYCSFCESEVDRINATHGTGRLKRSSTEELMLIGGQYHLREKITYFSSKVVACPQCVLKVTSGIQFPSDE